MTAPRPKIDPALLPERLKALPGLDRVREAAAGLAAYLVGGSVRDLLLGRGRSDLDIAVEGGAVDELARRLGGAVRTHERFDTATVRAAGTQLDLAATRAETYPRPGALPVITPAPLVEDLARRDFTVNAMAVPLADPSKLIDPQGGLADLERGALRILHDGSFVDDPTRALRAARYAARYGFTLEPSTAERVRNADLETVSADRTSAELRKLAAEPKAANGFALLSEWGLLRLGPDARGLIDAVSELVADPPWRDFVPRDEAVLAAALGRGAEEAKRLAEASPSRASEGVELASGRTGAELALARAMGAGWLDRYVSHWRRTRLEIDGGDLLAEGVSEGPAIGRGLAEAMRAKLDGEVSGADEELRVALRAAREGTER
jgi:tRNA nucleotidyltransferase (CCA-adding enzyme)